jgi:ADP-heptose:LPS heptosyltransferase
MRRASVVVAADSGLLHLAQAVGTSAVALFGPKDPEVYGPRLADSIVLRYPTACAPCGRRSCDAPLCVQAIPVAGVHAAVHELLAKKG